MINYIDFWFFVFALCVTSIIFTFQFYISYYIIDKYKNNKNHDKNHDKNNNNIFKWIGLGAIFLAIVYSAMVSQYMFIIAEMNHEGCDNHNNKKDMNIGNYIANITRSPIIYYFVALLILSFDDKICIFIHDKVMKLFKSSSNNKGNHDIKYYIIIAIIIGYIALNGFNVYNINRELNERLDVDNSKISLSNYFVLYLGPFILASFAMILYFLNGYKFAIADYILICLLFILMLVMSTIGIISGKCMGIRLSNQ